ncbi:putative transcription factor B3-Domain family [Helianthus annuus]|uniref:Transcription factor B3-Domain family n=1 Tax=Helianthus annuus TaxID=4232 RepID=A0A9K3HXP4_HELAN|nr:putative transcription factor B3-Domain family [Helianthus annuus]
MFVCSLNKRRIKRLMKVMLKNVFLVIVLVTFNFQILRLFLTYDTDDSKFDRLIPAQIEMEEAKKLFKDGWNTKNDALKNTPSATSECDFDTKGKSKVVCGDQTVHPKVLTNVDMDLNNIAYRTRSNFPINNDCVDIDMTKPSENISVKSKRKACRPTTSPSNVCPKRKVKRSKNNSFLEFTKVAETRLRLPVDVSYDLCLSVDNLRDVSIQNLSCELSNMKTRAEKSGDGYRYGFTKWSSFLKSNHIPFGATLFFKYIKSSQLLVLTNVVHKTIKKRARA